MGQPTTNSIADINSTRILKIKWPDKTYTLINEGFTKLNGNLTIKFNFKDTNGQPKEPYINNYDLDSFDTEIGVVQNVVFERISNNSNSTNHSNPSA